MKDLFAEAGERVFFTPAEGERVEVTALIERGVEEARFDSIEVLAEGMKIKLLKTEVDSISRGDLIEHKETSFKVNQAIYQPHLEYWEVFCEPTS